MKELKEGPRLLLLRKMLLENPTTAQQKQELGIEMGLAVAGRLQIPAKGSNL